MEDGTLASVNEGSGDRHCNVEFYLPADMAGHIALEGQGGTRDKRKHFCTHCECHLKHRHMPFQLIRVLNDTTVGDLALAHDMPVSLLWAVNAGRDFDCMFEPHELSEEHLGDLTLPLADEVSSEAAAADPQTVNAPEVSRPSPRQQGEMQHAMVGGDQGFGNAGAASRKRTAARRAQAVERPGRIVSAEWSLRKAVVGSVSDAEKLLVPRGMVIQVVQTHKMERRSQFVDQYLTLDRER